ncbi:oxidoreductase-like domain-containing protein [Xanthomonas sp. 1678]|uniref:oxidoreductase-like domain-containing protein n=1 Tax=Xanthomonas sp. 1678 TaxID=3158788 RepID=UPI00286BB300|nr:oxidoreductase-like domain-containing protein [Xanthomonas campestris pv. campestris]
MPDPASDPAMADPRPQPPEPPAPGDCCNSGCPLCVHDLYNEELERYRQALAAWRLRHPEAAPDA